MDTVISPMSVFGLAGIDMSYTRAYSSSQPPSGAVVYSVAIVGMMVNNAVMSVWLPEAAREYEQDPARA